MIKIADISAQLKEHLEKGEDWEKMETPIDGVSIIKVPATKTRTALLFLEINPLKADGRLLKRKGLFVNNKEMLIKFSETLNNDKTFHLISVLEKVNPAVSSNDVKKLEM